VTSPYLDLPRFSLSDTLVTGYQALCATFPRAMPDLDHTAPTDYRELARRLRELARTARPYARQELIQLAGIYERRGENLESCAG
jgi:hypothetical protein